MESKVMNTPSLPGEIFDVFVDAADEVEDTKRKLLERQNLEMAQRVYKTITQLGYKKDYNS
jgi:hypothetical protein